MSHFLNLRRAAILLPLVCLGLSGAVSSAWAMHTKPMIESEPSCSSSARPAAAPAHMPYQEWVEAAVAQGAAPETDPDLKELTRPDALQHMARWVTAAFEERKTYMTAQLNELCARGVALQTRLVELTAQALAEEEKCTALNTPTPKEGASAEDVATQEALFVAALASFETALQESETATRQKAETEEEVKQLQRQRGDLPGVMQRLIQSLTQRLGGVFELRKQAAGAKAAAEEEAVVVRRVSAAQARIEAARAGETERRQKRRFTMLFDYHRALNAIFDAEYRNPSYTQAFRNTLKSRAEAQRDTAVGIIARTFSGLPMADVRAAIDDEVRYAVKDLDLREADILQRIKTLTDLVAPVLQGSRDKALQVVSNITSVEDLRQRAGIQLDEEWAAWKKGQNKEEMAIGEEIDAIQKWHSSARGVTYAEEYAIKMDLMLSERRKAEALAKQRYDAASIRAGRLYRLRDALLKENVNKIDPEVLTKADFQRYLLKLEGLFDALLTPAREEARREEMAFETTKQAARLAFRAWCDAQDKIQEAAMAGVTEHLYANGSRLRTGDLSLLWAWEEKQKDGLMFTGETPQKMRARIVKAIQEIIQAQRTPVRATPASTSSLSPAGAAATPAPLEPSVTEEMDTQHNDVA